MPRAPKSRLDHSDTKWFITIGVLLALFAGSVALLVKSPQIRVAISPRQEAPAPTAPSPVVEAPAPAPAPEGLPEGGSVELVNVTVSDGNITDQKIVWRVESGDTILVESVNTLLPGLENGRRVLAVFARPTAIGGTGRVIFSIQFDLFEGPEGDMPLRLQIISFDPVLRSFIPLVNAPNVRRTLFEISPNGHRFAYADAQDEYQNLREIWVYNMVEDKLSRVLSLASSESLTSAMILIPSIDLSWKDPLLLQYGVYRAAPGELLDEARQRIATRTVKIEP